MLCSVLAMVNILDILVGTGIHTCFYMHKNPKNVPPRPTKVLSLLLEVLFVDEKNNPKLRHTFTDDAANIRREMYNRQHSLQNPQFCSSKQFL